MRKTTLILVFLLAPPALGQWCTGNNHVVWPSANPVWDLCWVSPVDSSGPSGSGLELRHVFYRGKRVFWRANMPVLNVLYDAGSGFCGPTYRDWFDELSTFDANNVISPGYAEPTATPKTTCDSPGTDQGSFQGVAVEKLADRLILTTQTKAGWYRYIQKITFHQDGRIEPIVGFTAVSHSCVNNAHTHHGYWRFDFDIDGPPSDRIRQRKTFLFLTWWSTIGTETTRNRASGRRWRVLDASGSGYEIAPGAHDGDKPDSFAGSDAWFLRYHGTETDDGGSTGGAMGDAQHIDPFVNGEAINGADVVLWYRVGHRHASGLACTLVGPTLRPINW